MTKPQHSFFFDIAYALDQISSHYSDENLTRYFLERLAGQSVPISDKTLKTLLNSSNSEGNVQSIDKWISFLLTPQSTNSLMSALVEIPEVQELSAHLNHPTRLNLRLLTQFLTNYSPYQTLAEANADHFAFFTAERLEQLNQILSLLYFQDVICQKPDNFTLEKYQTIIKLLLNGQQIINKAHMTELLEIKSIIENNKTSKHSILLDFMLAIPIPGVKNISDLIRFHANPDDINRENIKITYSKLNHYTIKLKYDFFAPLESEIIKIAKQNSLPYLPLQFRFYKTAGMLLYNFRYLYKLK